MSDESPKRRRRNRKHSPDTRCVNSILVEFVAEMVPHDSPEFQERARRAAQRRIPDYLKGEPKPNDPPPPAN